MTRLAGRAQCFSATKFAPTTILRPEDAGALPEASSPTPSFGRRTSQGRGAQPGIGSSARSGVRRFHAPRANPEAIRLSARYSAVSCATPEQRVFKSRSGDKETRGCYRFRRKDKLHRAGRSGWPRLMYRANQYSQLLTFARQSGIPESEEAGYRQENARCHQGTKPNVWIAIFARAFDSRRVLGRRTFLPR